MSINMNVNVQAVKESMGKAYHVVGHWLGRSIEIIKANSVIEDRRIAFLSLCLVNLISFQLIDVFIGKVIRKIRKENKEFYLKNEKVILTAELIFGSGVIASAVSLFAKFTKLPFSKLTILGISVLIVSIELKLSLDGL